MSKRKMIYYKPGLVSLVLLPMLFIYFANRELRSRNLMILTIYLGDTSFLKSQQDLLQLYKGHFPPVRRYSEIVLTGNKDDDGKKLHFAEIRIREIISQNDTLTGIHFSFGDSSNYETFVKTIDILQIERAKTYLPIDNNLWFYKFPPNKNSFLLPLEIPKTQYLTE